MVKGGYLIKMMKHAMTLMSVLRIQTIVIQMHPVPIQSVVTHARVTLVSVATANHALTMMNVLEILIIVIRMLLVIMQLVVTHVLVSLVILVTVKYALI